MNRFIAMAMSVFLLLTTAQADDAVWTSDRGLFDVSYTTELEPLQINVLHSWTLHLEDAGGAPILGATIEADGGMPQHDHGLPTRPRITKELGNGDYQLDGIRFHMRGDWELTFTVEAEGKTDTVVVKVTL